MRLAFLFALGCSSAAEIGYQPGSPWPKFRGNAVQDGATSRVPRIHNGSIWSFATGKGIFSSPVIGADGTIYVGSADRTFYAVNPDGSLKWKLLTGEIIDSAALLDDRGRVYFGSGDGNLRALDAKSGALVWQTAADPPAANSALINWFEGNVALSPDGTLWAGNDNFNLYGVDRGGNIAKRIRMPDQTWSLPAFDLGSGDFFVGNNNLVDFEGSNLFAFHQGGAPSWDLFTGAGTVAASPMLMSGVLFVGGFDGFVRAYDEKSGAQKWEFGARDHLYASPARLPDGSVVQASADGSVYALDPATGNLRWEFDGRDPIRSSPSVDGSGNLYYGGGDGRLWVLGPDGKVRWSVQLISDDRNDLNASPALGDDAVYLAGESGELFSVPYEYCVGSSDSRCLLPENPSLPDDGGALLYTTPFGSQLASPPPQIDPNQPLVFSLVAQTGGRQILAVLDATTVQVDSPAFSVDVSGDGKFLTLVPIAPLSEGPLSLNISAGYLVDLDRTGLKLSGGTAGGTVDLAFSSTVNSALASPAPFATFELSRVALPLPTLLPSYNQIGFDSLHYLIGRVEDHVAWMAGAKLDDQNRTVIDPATGALFPLAVDDTSGYFTAQNQDGVSVEVMNAVIPFRSFRLSGALTAADVNRVRLIGSTLCAGIPLYGLFLQKLGLCNPQTDVLLVSGAADLRPYTPDPISGAGTVTFTGASDAVTATLTGSTLDGSAHVASVLLIDAATGQPVTLDYGLDSQRALDGNGFLTSVKVSFGQKPVPSSVRAYLMVDTTAAATATLTLP